MKYKIVTNGEKFRIMEKGWLFWSYIESYSIDGLSGPETWHSRESAQKWIDSVSREWRDA